MWNNNRMSNGATLANNMHRPVRVPLQVTLGNKQACPPGAAERVQDLITEYPAAVLAAGLSLGLTLGWWLKRH
jgi:hypothetical protein